MSRPRKRDAPLPPRIDSPVERSAAGLPKKVRVGQKMYDQVRPSPVIDMRNMRHKLLPVYHKLSKSATTYTINYGSGGSGKSHAQAQYLVKRLLTKRQKLMVIRKYGTTLNDSVIEQFKEVALPFFGLRE